MLIGTLTSAIGNKTILLILMVALIVFILLTAVLGVIFIVALRKRAPVVKVVMAPQTYDGHAVKVEHTGDRLESSANATDGYLNAAENVEYEQTADNVRTVETEEPDDDAETDEIVTEGSERVRYDRSFTAKICQLKKEPKEWYGELKNELLSYEKVRERTSWRRESFRIGRMTVARFVVRGMTLCMTLAVEPAGYAGTKYKVEDVSNVSVMADTPTLVRIKSARKVKYAKEMIAAIMKELKIYKNAKYEPSDFYMPYEGNMALMQRGLVKRIVSGSTRTFRIEEIETEKDKNPFNKQ